MDFTVKPVSPAERGAAAADRETIVRLLRAATLTVDPAFAPAKAMPSGITPLGTIYMSLEGLMDVRGRDRSGSPASSTKTDGGLERVARKLENMDFVSKAPAEVVEQQRARQAGAAREAREAARS